MTISRLRNHSPPRTLPEPPKLSVSTARFASPFPSPRRGPPGGCSQTQATSPPARSTAAVAAHTSTTVATTATASLSSMPSELLLAICAHLYLPPDEFSNAHSRSQDLCALGLAGGALIQAVVRTILFRQVELRSQSEVRFLVRHPELAALVRSLALSSSTIKHYLPLLLPLMPDLSTLILSCKMTLRDLALLEPPRLVAQPNVPLLAPAFSPASPSPAGQSSSMPNPTSLQLDISEPLSAGLLQMLLRSSLVTKVEDLSISARFIRAGLMVDVVELPQATIIAFVDELVSGLPALQRLALPITAGKTDKAFFDTKQVSGHDGDEQQDVSSASSLDAAAGVLVSSSAAAVSLTEGPAVPPRAITLVGSTSEPPKVVNDSMLVRPALKVELRSRFLPPLERLRLGGAVGPALEMTRER